jgi:2-keto-4-pentenoate hydratase
MDNPVMNDKDFEAARSALVEARRSARGLLQWPSPRLPADLPEAYRLQAAVLEAFGPIGAWKVGALSAEQQGTMGLASPVAGPIPASLLRDARAAPATYRFADFIAPLIECEFAFELDDDLPPRADAAYTREEVAASTLALRIAIELVDPRLPRGSGALAELADGFNNGGLIVGAQQREWRDLDYAKIDIVVTSDAGGKRSDMARGNGRAILSGDPFGAVVLLANTQPPGRGLRAGDIVTTGSCTGAPRLPGPGHYRAEFAGLGVVELALE